MSRSEEVELLGCPFCGGEARCDIGVRAFADAEITCLSCGTTGPNFDDGDRVFNREAAIIAWNTRAPSALPVASGTAVNEEGTVYTAAQLLALLESRDNYLVSKGLFSEYADSLTAT